MSAVSKAILITTDGEFKVVSWDDTDHVENVREALAGIPAMFPGTDELGWGAMFGRDPEIHPQGEVNVLATYAVERFTGQRVYAFGDVVICGVDQENQPVGFQEDQEFIVNYLTQDGGSLDNLSATLSKNPRVMASIQKLEDIRPEEEKESVPE
jgi:hypothetical protein